MRTIRKQKIIGLFVIFISVFLLNANSVNATTMRIFSDAGEYGHKEYTINELVAMENSVNWSMAPSWKVQPKTEAPYASGRLSDEALNNLLAQLNFFRSIAHLDSVGLKEEYINYAQTGTVLNAATEFSHYPSKPDDMDDSFYEIGYKGTSSSNLSWTMGYGDLGMMRALRGCLSDSGSSNISRLGHRRWILNPTMKNTGFGHTIKGSESFTAMYVFDYSFENVFDFVSWPGGNEVFPAEYFVPSDPWSIQLSQDVFKAPVAGNVVVELSRLSDNKTWVFKNIESNTSASKYFNINNEGYGFCYCIIFKPDLDVTEYSGKYSVKVTGLETKSGENAGITYTVDFQKLSDAVSLSKPEKPNKISNVVQGSRVYWKAVSGASKYNVWRSENGKDGNYTKVATVDSLNYLDKSVKGGKTYYYKISAVGSNGTETEKSDAYGITFVETPDITLRVNRSVGIGLGWNKITGATGYAIYRKSYNGNDAWNRVATITNPDTLTWNDTSVKSAHGTAYRYTIRALAGAKRNILSGCRNTGRTMVRLSNTYFKSLSKASATSIKAEWASTNKATGYEIRFMVGNSVYKTFTIGSNSTAKKTFTGLQSGKKYKIQVRSYKKMEGVGTFYSAWSTEKYVQL